MLRPTVLADALAIVRSDPDDISQNFRMLADASVRMEAAPTKELIAAMSADPGLIDDVRWDALVGGIVDRLARLRDIPSPAWAADPRRYSPDPWYVSQYPAVQASALDLAPPELAARGVYCHEESLTGL